jgi:ribose transport system ATP-binding protein
VILVPGNRQRDAVWMDADARENFTFPFVSRFRRSGFLRRRDEDELTLREMQRFSVRPLDPDKQIRRFSGGNQQKIVLARCMMQEPVVLLMHEPTQGVDAGARKDILELVRAAVENGTSVILFSTEIEMVAETATRVVVLGYGRVWGELGDAEVSEDALLAACLQAAQGQQQSTQEEVTA